MSGGGGGGGEWGGGGRGGEALTLLIASDGKTSKTQWSIASCIYGSDTSLLYCITV